LLEQHGDDHRLLGHQIFRTDFFRIMDSVLVDPFPVDGIKDVEEERGRPVCEYRSSECQVCVRYTLNECWLVGKVEWRVEVLKAGGVIAAVDTSRCVRHRL
jgi:hypothetical protein